MVGRLLVDAGGSLPDVPAQVRGLIAAPFSRCVDAILRALGHCWTQSCHKYLSSDSKLYFGLALEVRSWRTIGKPWVAAVSHTPSMSGRLARSSPNRRIG